MIVETTARPDLELTITDPESPEISRISRTEEASQILATSASH